MKKFLMGFNKFLDIIFNVLQTYSKVVLLGVVLLVSAQVISRKFLHYSIVWSEDVYKRQERTPAPHWCWEQTALLCLW